MLVLLLLLACREAPLDLPEGTWALTGVDVLPLTSEVVLEDHVVLVAGETILEVRPAAGLELPEEVQVVDGGGATVLPGLVDMHVHSWFEPESALFVAHGVTTVRNLFGDPVHLDWRDRIAAGDMLGPTILTSGPIVDGSPPYWPGSEVVTDAEDAAGVVEAQVEAGYDRIKVYNALDGAVWRALVEEGAARGVPVEGHVPWAVGYRDALDAGQHTIEHLEGWFFEVVEPGDIPADYGELPAALEGLDAGAIAALAADAAASGTYNTPTLLVYDRLVAPAESAGWAAAPEMAWVHPTLREQWSTAYAGYDAETLAAFAAYADALPRWTLALHEAGAPLLLGTDATNAWVIHGLSAHEELAALVDAGLTPYEALRSGTVVAAEALGQRGAIGTIEAGARADLLLVDGDPLEDITATRNIRGVVLRGAWLDRERLDAELEAVAAAYEGEGRRSKPPSWLPCVHGPLER